MISKWKLCIFLCVFSSTLCFAKPKIYDCFLFFNELDLLFVRLEEMYEHVDHFVLIESRESFQGKPKSLYYQKNQDLYSKYADKIIHIVLNDIQPQNGHWARETFQRNQIERGLTGCADNDIVLVSDLDEMIRGADMSRFLAPVISGQLQAVSAHQRFFRWFLNRESSEHWVGTVATTYQNLKRHSPQGLRSKKDQYTQYHDVGWHFSNMGGLPTYVAKIENFSHAEADTPANKDPQRIYKYVQEALRLVPIDESFPKYVREHQAELLMRGFIDFPGNSRYY